MVCLLNHVRVMSRQDSLMTAASRLNKNDFLSLQQGFSMVATVPEALEMAQALEESKPLEKIKPLEKAKSSGSKVLKKKTATAVLFPWMPKASQIYSPAAQNAPKHQQLHPSCHLSPQESQGGVCCMPQEKASCCIGKG